MKGVALHIVLHVSRECRIVARRKAELLFCDIERISFLRCFSTFQRRVLLAAMVFHARFPAAELRRRSTSTTSAAAADVPVAVAAAVVLTTRSTPDSASVSTGRHQAASTAADKNPASPTTARAASLYRRSASKRDCDERAADRGRTRLRGNTIRIRSVEVALEVCCRQKTFETRRLSQMRQCQFEYLTALAILCV